MTLLQKARIPIFSYLYDRWLCFRFGICYRHRVEKSVANDGFGGLWYCRECFKQDKAEALKRLGVSSNEVR